MLQRIQTPPKVDSRPVPPKVREMIADVLGRVQAFQDRWDQPQIEQFVAADYELVYQHLDWMRESQLLIGQRFIEWGCGFAAVTMMARQLGWQAFGVEIERTLLEQARVTVRDWSAKMGLPELCCGNFLPDSSESLADDPTLPSLGHGGENVYETLGLDLDDFAIVYSYPWPGEEDFHQDVFDRHAAPGAILVQFCGPYDVRLHRRLFNPGRDCGK